MLAYDWNFLGLSTETKPLSGEKVVDGSTFYECDTSTFFIYYQGKWYQQTFVTEDGINFWLYKTLMKKMFGKWFDGNISLGKIIKPTTGTEIEFTNSLPAQITDLTGYGDTFQQTYSGKNIEDFSTINYRGVIGATGTRVGGTYTVDTGSDSWGGVIFEQTDLQLEPNTTYTFSATVQSTTNPSGSIVLISRSITYNDTTVSGNYVTADGRSIATFTTPGTIPSDGSIRLLPRATNATAVFTDIQLEKGSTATSYEPYVGGIASPNPDYPQSVQTVTGEQTVTINGEQVYTIDLGAIELCKIGGYQDYIYKSGDDWYVHKEVGKVILDGTETWSSASMTNNYMYYTVVSGLTTTSASQLPNIYSNYFTKNTANAQWTSAAGIPSIATNDSASPNTQLRITVGDSTNQLAIFKTWLGRHNTNVYYALATPTVTKITDSTLISNLNSLLNYIFPVGDHQLIITADTLPMALKLTITEKE